MYSFLLNLPNFYRDFFFKNCIFLVLIVTLHSKIAQILYGEWLVWGRGLGK